MFPCPYCKGKLDVAETPREQRPVTIDHLGRCCNVFLATEWLRILGMTLRPQGHLFATPPDALLS